MEHDITWLIMESERRGLTLEQCKTILEIEARVKAKEEQNVKSYLPLPQTGANASAAFERINKDEIDKLENQNDKRVRICYKDDATPEQIQHDTETINNIYLEQEAERRGFTLEQYKHILVLEARVKAEEEKKEALLMQRQREEALLTQQVYPNFDLNYERTNQNTGKRFSDLLDKGIDVKTAYEIIHIDEIKNNFKSVQQTMHKRSFVVLASAIIASVFFIIGAFELPYGYYMFLRIASLFYFGINAYAFHSNENMFFTFIFIILCILFNPIVPVELTKVLWITIDIITAIIVIIAGVVYHVKYRIH